tara:strand:+ start:205 stop:357 length:153 start_codon:yes stop_codon:yes gene_type:complete
MSENRMRRTVYVQTTVKGKRTWKKVGSINSKGQFTPGIDIALELNWGLED